MPGPSSDDWPEWIGRPDRDAAAIDVIRIPLPADVTIVPSEFPELTPDEVRRAERYLVEPPRRQFVMTRVALRRVCGELLSLPPRDVTFEFAQFGKPLVAVVQNPNGLAFNVTHSGPSAVIAIGWRRRIGVDIEVANPRLNWRGLAKRFFSAGEQEQLAALPEPQQQTGFYRVWTGKEAFLKATGLGMSFPLDQFTMTADPAITPAVLHLAGDDNAPSQWTGAAFTPGEDTIGTLLWDHGPATVRQWTWPSI